LALEQVGVRVLRRGTLATEVAVFCILAPCYPVARSNVDAPEAPMLQLVRLTDRAGWSAWSADRSRLIAHG
jgi:hypothetical protein